MTHLIFLTLAITAFATTPPYVIRDLDNPRDIQSITDNDRVLASQIDDVDLTDGGTVVGGLDVSSLTVGSSGISFSDATTQTTAFIVRVSSSGIVPKKTNITITNLSLCVEGSTRTATFPGDLPVLVEFSGNGSNTAQDHTRVGFLLDGDYVDNFASNVSAMDCISQAGASFQCNLSFSWEIKATDISAGEHDFCLTAGTSSGTSSLGSGHGAQDTGLQFRVREL